MQAPDDIRDSLIRLIYNINEKDFDSVAIEVWKYQYRFNPLYKSYCNLLGIGDADIRYLADIPFLPIATFREHEVRTGQWEAERIFRSSGTTGTTQSKHLIRDLAWYHKVAEKCFSVSFGDPGLYAWIGLLPSYLERQDSSLVDMVNYFMHGSHKNAHSFYPKADEEMISYMEFLQQSNKLTILLGVSFALLDLFEQHKVPVWENLLVMVTGGMKGRGPEITAEELHLRLSKDHKDLRIASEYGMTELLSQAYKVSDHFQPGATMRVRIRDISDPLALLNHGQRGVINVVDLANIDTCSFIATDDLGIAYADGDFDVLGRLDNSDLRGCNLLFH